MQSARPSVHVGVGDWMPRITLPLACGRLFDSWDPATSGMAWSTGSACRRRHAGRRAGWLRDPAARGLQRPRRAFGPIRSCVIDRLGECDSLRRREPLAIVVDAAGRVAAVVPHPTADDVASLVTQLYRASTPAVIHAQAPVLLLERVVETDLCAALIDYWQHHDKLANRGRLGGRQCRQQRHQAAAGRAGRRSAAVHAAARLPGAPRRAGILRAFHIGIMVIEAPIIGCYDADCGGRFGRRRDNTSSPPPTASSPSPSTSTRIESTTAASSGSPSSVASSTGRPRAVRGLLLIAAARGRAGDARPPFGAFTFLSASGPGLNPDASSRRV